MDEKVERSAEDNNVSRQVRRPVVSEAFLQSGHGIAYEANAIPPNLRPLILGKLNGGMRVANYSVQTGEEFALQFAQEASRSRRGLDMEQVPLQKINPHEANPYVYEDLTGLLGIGRVDSGTNSEISMLAAERGNMSDFGSHCNPVYPESLQGIQSSRFGNDGVYQMDEGTFAASTRQTKPQHMSHSIHRSYLSARSNDSSSGKVKFMSSYGGRILPRPSDGRLRYVGGDTRIISVNKDIGYEELMQKIIDIYGQVLILKYQLPGEDLDALVSVSSDEDLENMMEEYDKLDNNDGSARLRIFLFTLSDNDLAQFDAMADKRYSELQYVDAVNGIPETSVRKYQDSLGSFSSHHLDNLIGLDGADNWNFNKRAEEGLDSLRAQVSKDGTKIVNSSSAVLSSSKPPVSNASFATNPSTLSVPFSSLPMHVKHSVIADAPIHFKPEQINSHSYSVVRSPEGYNDIDCGRPISSDVFQHEVEYKHRESRISPDSSTIRQNDFILPSHSDSMYKGDGWVADTKVVQSILNVRSDGLHPVELQRIGKVPPPVHQPVWLHNFDGEQYSYKTTDSFPHSKSAEVYLQQPVQQHTVQNIHPIVLQTANHYPGVSKHSDQVHAHHDDMLEGSQDTNSTNEPFHNVLKQVGSSPSSPCQGGGQLYGQVHQTRNAPYVDEQDSGSTVPPDNSQFNASLFPLTSPDSCEQLHEEAVNEQSLPLDKSPSEARLPQQKTHSYEQVTDLDEGFIHSQALPHVLSDSVLQTHVTRSVHPMCEGIPVSQGHHSDSLLGVLPPYAESSISQERLVSFQDHEGGGDAKSQIFHQGEQIPPIFSGWQQGKVTWGSGESFKDDSDKNAQKNPLERDDKMDTVVRTRKDQSECNDEERIAPLSGSKYPKPAVGFGGIGSSEDMNTSLPQVFGDSYQTHKKTERLETIAAAYQLKVSTTETSEGETCIITEAVQQSQLSGRINHTGVLRSAPGAQEGKIPNLFEEHTISYPAGNVNLQVPAVDQTIASEKLVEPVCSPYMLTGGVDSCAPLTTSEMWLGEMRLEADITKDDTSKYAHEATGKTIDELSNDHFNSAVTNDTNRPVQYHPGQFMGKSLIDVDYGDSASQLSAINKFLDELASSSAAHVPATTQDGIYKKVDPLNYDMSKGVLQQSAGDQVIGNLLNESSTEDFPMHLDAMGDALVQLNLHELFDIGREVDLRNISPDMAAVINLNYPPASTISDVEWTPGSEDVRVDENISLGKVVEVPDEESIAIQDSDNDIEDSDKDEPLSDAAIAESEAIAHGLQIIKNADLEELRELGSGTFGTVYHGKWRGSDVAIKRIKNSCFTGRPSEQERMRADFWREAWILANLHHPNVVAFYGVVPDGPGGTLATVTEYMVNGSLKQVLQRKDRTIDRRKRLLIAMDAAFGMEYLHGKHIVHFDLKCENLLVNMRDPQRPICKVGDLGLSKIKHQTLVSGGVRGTLPWMAPELLNGSSSMVSEKVDVFSFGIVMWELLTGEEPYANMHYGAIIGGIVNNTLRPPVPNWCDPAWRSLMEQCWSADPSARPSFTEIANRLRAMAISFHSKVHGNHPHVHHT